MTRPTPTDIADLLRRHRLWLDQAVGGKRVDCSDTDLRGVDFSGADLRHAVLVRADLRGANLEGAVLDNADLTEAELSGVRFPETSLANARLVNANLEQADLSQAGSLVENQLAGCNLLHATLPDSFDFPGVALADEAGNSLRAELAKPLMLCLYSWLIISSTRDLDLVLNASSVSFPFVDLSLPIVGVYFITPLLVVTLFFSFHLRLALFWDRLAQLPAIFPSGHELTQKLHSSFYVNLINQHMLQLSRRRATTLLGRLNILAVRLGLRGVVFVTLLSFWWAYLPRHELLGTTLHLILLLAVVVTGWGFSVQMHHKLEMTPMNKDSLRHSWQPIVASLATIILILSCGYTFHGPRVPWSHVYADLKQQRISAAKEAPEKESEDALALADGAELHGKNLRFADMEGAFAAGATFSKSDLAGANLRQADLRSADLSNAHLVDTSLQRAKLQHARFVRADLARADLSTAALQGADLSQARLGEAVLAGARVDRARFSRADLSGAELSGVVGKTVDFSLARLDNARLTMATLAGSNFFLADLKRARLWKTRLQGSSLILVNANNANLSYAQLEDADLAQANLDRAVLRGAKLVRSRLVFARLNHADLSQAQLEGADLSQAQLEGADLRGSHLAGARLDNAWMKEARLDGVDLEQVVGLTRQQLAYACFDDSTRLPAPLRADQQALLAASKAAHARTGACAGAGRTD